MTRKFTNAVVLVGCAWVLWGVPEIDRKLFPFEGFTTKDACMKELQYYETLKFAFGLRCLPDTIDPRRPK
jgi:hypothetical protein